MLERLGNLPAGLVLDGQGQLQPWAVQENFDKLTAFLNNPFLNSPLHDYVAASQSTASGVNTDLTTDGPSITAPTAGDYLLTANMQGSNSTAGAYATVEIYNAGVATGILLYAQSAIANQALYPALVAVPITVAADGDVVKMRYRTGGGGTGTFAQRALSLLRLTV